ncbi:MAG: hypothetical protein CL927_20015 [Deltaproteobacteria bacterium]|nr:hypothetical protein [Deltaproteobacteria bacterium]HCH61901.1 hypothetical protein [Deltaproteobacteria bacterium]
MGRIRQLIRASIRQVSSVVARNELFERPGERAVTAPLSPRQVEPEAPVPSPTMSQVGAANVAESAPHPAAKADDDRQEPRLAQQIEVCDVVDIERLTEILGPKRGVRVVNHWATWCIPCIEEFDLLKSLFDRLPEGVAFQGISWDLFDPRGDEDDIAEHVVNFATGHALPWDTVLIGEETSPESFFEAFSLTTQTVPQTWVLDDSGSVVHRIEGALVPAQLEGVLGAVQTALQAGSKEAP